MLFNSYAFIFAYLPTTLIIAYILMRFGKPLFIPWLLASSLFFYGWWNPAYLPLLVLSITMNYLFARLLNRDYLPVLRKQILVVGILCNLLLLFYYKYSNFFINNINSLFDSHLSTLKLILPLGISFFTFTQIAFLVDTYHKQASNVQFVSYALFVTYFPHLVAGPIIHHSDVMPQFEGKKQANRRPLLQYLMIGGTIFLLGLFKKVCIADQLALKVDTLFLLPQDALHISFLDAWFGALGYTFQLYFDFSGYSDMAIGLSYMLGIKLPVNFFSPYKARNIIDFWRRWHMTLSRFFRDYLYIPLGGNQLGIYRTLLNVFIVMLTVGFWHGAGWTFILWGGYHGMLLMLNHAWNHFKMYTPHQYKRMAFSPKWSHFGQIIAHHSTFIGVVFGWVLFRADNLNIASNFYAGMLYFHQFYAGSLGLHTEINYILFGCILLACLFIVLFLPNSIEIMRTSRAALNTKSLYHTFGDTSYHCVFQWRPSILMGIIVSSMGYLAITGIGSTPDTFLYFNF